MFEKYREIIPEFDEFLKRVKNFRLVSIRANVLKTKPKILKEKLEEAGFSLSSVKWYRSAFVVRKNEDLVGKTLEHALGYYYVQRLESMVPALVLKPKKHELILDLCAAPGSKTTQIAELMRNTGRVIANDISEKRLRALFSNLERQGVVNVSVTRYDGRRFPEIVKFEKILVDAPCTAEGRSFKERSMAESKKLAEKQYKLLKRAVQLCANNGIVVYSTCTLSPLENELVVSRILRKFENVRVEKARIKGLKACNGVEEWKSMNFESSVKKCLRLYPHISGTGGFFVAKLRVY